MSPKVPQAYLEARRTEILEAAVKCFMEKGFHNTTMQDIYKATNLSPGAVYNYFPSKEDIVVEAIKEFSDWSISIIAPIVSEKSDESFTKFFHFWLSLIKQDGATGESTSLQLDLYAEAIRNSNIREAVLKSQEATHEKLIELIKHNQREGMLNAKLDPLSIARAIMGMIFGIMIHKSLDPEVDLESYRQVCEAMINGTFSGPPQRRRRAGKQTK
jgi:AcrR family transcriptional regulator